MTVCGFMYCLQLQKVPSRNFHLPLRDMPIKIPRGFHWNCLDEQVLDQTLCWLGFATITDWRVMGGKSQISCKMLSSCSTNTFFICCRNFLALWLNLLKLQLDIYFHMNQLRSSFDRNWKGKCNRWRKLFPLKSTLVSKLVQWGNPVWICQS